MISLHHWFCGLLGKDSWEGFVVVLQHQDLILWKGIVCVFDHSYLCWPSCKYSQPSEQGPEVACLSRLADQIGASLTQPSFLCTTVQYGSLLSPGRLATQTRQKVPHPAVSRLRCSPYRPSARLGAGINNDITGTHGYWQSFMSGTHKENPHTQAAVPAYNNKPVSAIFISTRNGCFVMVMFPNCAFKSKQPTILYYKKDYSQQNNLAEKTHFLPKHSKVCTQSQRKQGDLVPGK